MHLNDGQLRASVDGELAGPAAEHLLACPACQARLAQAQARAGRVAARLARLEPGAADQPRAARAALARLRGRQVTASSQETVMQSLFSRRTRSMWISLGAVAALVVALSFSPVRTWAAGFLGLFRVQQITILPIDATRFTALNDDSTLGDQISQMFSKSLKMEREPGDPVEVASAAEASQAAGFQVRLPAGESAGQIVVQSGAAFEFVVDRDLAQSILNDAGRGDLQLPESLDGATIRVDIPAGVSAAYGDCPDMTVMQKDGEIPEGKYDTPRECVILAAIPSPTVDLPPDVDLTQLAEIGLQFTGMSAEEAHAFSQTVDWESTLVIPLPQNAASYEQVAVDGVTGNLIYRNPNSEWRRYTLLWAKDGIVYALAGFGQPEAGIALANSLP